MLSAVTDKYENRKPVVEEAIVRRSVRQSFNAVKADVGDSVDEVGMLKEEEENIKGQFQIKRLLVAGMMDVSLMTSNANQLKYILAHQLSSASTIICVVLISLSLFLQICSGVGFIYKVSFRRSQYLVLKYKVAHCREVMVLVKKNLDLISA